MHPNNMPYEAARGIHRMGQLQDKVALIIGASTHGGIGEATALHYVREGARVVLSARRLKEAQGVAAAVGADAIACDITDESQVEHLVRAVVTRHPGALPF